MKMAVRLLIFAVLSFSPLVCAVASAANIYYVIPRGDDAKDGMSAASAWKTCGKINKTNFEPGDTILFERGGEWREQLCVSSSGVPDKPVTFDAFGTGPKPKFFGSDVVPNNAFIALGGGKYSFKMPVKTDAVLQDHEFIPSTWDKSAVTVTLSSTDPGTNGRLYTACTRGNVIYAANKKHIVLRNLIADETAGQLDDGTIQGYGIRIERCTNVLLENCEAYRCGRHHFGAINTTGFIGRHLHAAYAMPNMPGGNTFYVAYADEGAPAGICTGEWDGLSADHMEDGKNGLCPFFISHGPKQGALLISNADSVSKLSFMSAPVTIKGGVIRGTGSIENFGAGILIDGVTLLDNAAVDQWASDGMIQNCVGNSTPTNNGPTGYSTAILLRDKARNNVVRFNTLVSRRFACLTILAQDSATQWFGNIMISENSNTVSCDHIPAGKEIDYNFYSPNHTICGQAFASWQAKGFDTHSLNGTGDPKFVDAAKGDFHLQAGSPCLGAAKTNKERIAPKDFTGTTRPKSQSPNMGAFE